MGKTQISMKVSPELKADVEMTAERCQMTVTAYVTRLHLDNKASMAKRYGLQPVTASTNHPTVSKGGE